tara:strand:- start:4398 stop:4973 length:576 start_codon:yes stop_codon:yes gene_type:complete
MKKIKIGVQGARGSFSEEAALHFSKNYGFENVEIVYLISSESVLENLQLEAIEYGVFAMENAQGGVVIESIEALAKYQCKIIEMFHISVSQNLLAISDVNLGDIKEIHSHQQALRQCKNYLSENFWTRPLVEADDTAESARRLSEGELPHTVGVIGSKACADLYNLNILEEDIHDLKNNITLFLGVEKYGK